MGRGVRSSARLSGGAGEARPAAALAALAAEQRSAEAAEARAKAQERRARAKERAREVEDSPRVLRDKCRRLARALRDAKHLVVYTGAGISTAADIPDYRGPHGVWTRLQRGEAVGRVEVARAQPTFTHMALTALWASGALKFVVSQNCDGLHLRAGLPRRALAELHGDMFAEHCAACRRVYLRAFDTTERTARHAHNTRRLCHACGRELRDSIVHFGERGRAAWPLNWAGALRHAAAADVVLCLGSSLKVLRRYPRLWRMQRAPHARPALYIVNLQWTPKDAVAALKINARCDTVMAAVARRLRLRVPRYCARRDPLLAHAVPLAPAERHTARRAPLAPPPLNPDSDSDACYSLGSPSPSSASASASASASDASDSDDCLPLRRLADRLRAQRAPSPPAPSTSAPRSPRSPGESPTDEFHSFQVSLRSCEATILLRAEHAPSVLPPPEPPPLPPPPPAPRGLTGDLRRFRMHRPPALWPSPYSPACPRNGIDALTNGHGPDRNFNITSGPLEPEAEDGGARSCGSKLRRLLEIEPCKKEEPEDEAGPGSDAEAKCAPRAAAGRKCKVQLPVRAGAEAREADEAAAAFIRRAVLLCRASLYPGLHTILAGERGCAWCERRLGARRCLWYGAPPDAGAPRAARKVRGRRYLCACCPAPHAPPSPLAPLAPHAPHAPPSPLPDDAGWYGKGYRKGRRRRR